MEDDGIIIWKSAWNSGTSTGQFNWTQLAHPACDAGTAIGSTGTIGAGQCFVSRNGHFELLLQTDGNLVLYNLGVTPAAALWSTNTAIVSPVDPAVAMRTLYSYDALGNLYCVEQHGTAASGTACPSTPPSPTAAPIAPDPNNAWRRRLFAYDSLSRLLWASNPESGIISYSYDNDGNLLYKTSPAPNQTGAALESISYCYDKLHRVVAKGYTLTPAPPVAPQQCLSASPWLPNPAVVYAYDSGTNGIGHLTLMTDQAGTDTYTYDIMGRVSTEQRVIAGISKSMSYSYNLDGSLKTLTYPSNRVVTYTPNGASRLISAVDSNSTQYVSNVTHYPTGAEYQRFMPGIYFRTDMNPRLQISGFYSDNGVTSSFS